MLTSEADPVSPPVVAKSAILFPETDPKTAAKLYRGELYVVESADPFVLKQKSDGGGIAFEVMQGPLPMYAQFAYGAGKYENRTIKGPYIQLGKVDKTGGTTIIVAPKTVNTADDVVLHPVDVDAGQDPQPVQPPTPIIVVPPVDEAQSAINKLIAAAYATEASTDPDGMFKDRLAYVYRDAIKSAKSAKTFQQWYDTIHTIRGLWVKDDLPATRTAIGKSLFDVRLPRDSNAPFDQAKANAALLAAAKALEAIK